MAEFFAVIRSPGPAWAAGRAMEEQELWREHADFMNRLEEERLILLGGPLKGSDEVLLVARAEDPDTVKRRLSEDPWSLRPILPVRTISSWRLRIGKLD